MSRISNERIQQKLADARHCSRPCEACDIYRDILDERAALKIAVEALEEIDTWTCIMTPNNPCNDINPCPPCLARNALEQIRKIGT